MMEPIVEVGLPGGPRREVPVCAPAARVTAAGLAQRFALCCCGSLLGGDALVSGASPGGGGAVRCPGERTCSAVQYVPH
jgi:hypothetical protein